MHVLPLPFGLALALMARREAEQIHKAKPRLVTFRESSRERMPSELRYSELRRAI